MGSMASTSCKPQKSKKLHIDTGTMVTLGSSDKDNYDFECPKESEPDFTSDDDLDDILFSNAKVHYLVNQSLEDTHVLFMQGC
jgi:hypothetical protein